MNKTKIYYQPCRYIADDNMIVYGNIPNELCSFQAFATREDCEEWLENNGYDACDYAIIAYENDDIEDVTIIDAYGDVVEVNEDEEDETEDHYFSEDLCAVLEGRISSAEFRRFWGSISYDAMNNIINVGSNTIITNMD